MNPQFPSLSGGAERAVNAATFGDEVDAYNYAVAYFFSPIDYSVKVDGIGRVLPLNRNDLIELHVNGGMVVLDSREVVDGTTGEVVVQPHFRGPRDGEKGERVRLRYVGRWWINRHLTRQRTLYYRSRHDCVARVGYHSYDAARAKWAWAERFGITSTVQRFDTVGWMVLGFDLDAKHGETDVHALKDWLLGFFPGSYWEPSTSGSGIHLYVKMHYRVDLAGDRARTLEAIDRFVCRLSAHLEARRVKRFEAKIDQIRSLPTLLSWSDKDQRVRVAKRYSCIKAPRCAAGMEDIYRFHTAPFTPFDHLVALVERFDAEDATVPPPDSPEAQQGVADAYAKLSAANGDWESGEQAEPLPAAAAAPSCCVLGVPPVRGSKRTKNGFKWGRLEDLKRAEPDPHRRKLKMVWMLRWGEGRWQPVDYYLGKYHELGLNDGPVDGDQERQMSEVVTFAASVYDESRERRGVDLSAYPRERDRIAAKVGTGLGLTYRKEKGRVRNIGDEYAHAVLFVVDTEYRNGDGRISQQQVAERVGQVLGRQPPHRGLVQKVMNYLLGRGLLVKFAPPVWGMGRHNRGAGWRAA